MRIKGYAVRVWVTHAMNMSFCGGATTEIMSLLVPAFVFDWLGLGNSCFVLPFLFFVLSMLYLIFLCCLRCLRFAFKMIGTKPWGMCLVVLVSGDKILTGTTCQHQFHYECAMQWLYKDHQYDCPYCRKEMLTVTELQDAAQAILGEERSNELWQLNTTTTMTASTPDGGGGGGSHAHQVRRTASATVATTSMTPASA